MDNSSKFQTEQYQKDVQQEQELLEYEFRKYLKMSEIPQNNHKVREARFGQVLSQMYQTNANKRHQLNLLKALTNHQRAKSEYKSPFTLFKQNKVQTDLKKTQQQENSSSKLIKRQSLYGEYLTRTLERQQTHHLKLKKQLTEEQKRFSNQKKNQIFASQACKLARRKEGQIRLALNKNQTQAERFKNFCSLFLRQKRQVNALQSEDQQKQKHQHAQMKVKTKIYQFDNHAMKQRIVDLQESKNQLIHKADESISIFRKLSSIQMFVLASMKMPVNQNVIRETVGQKMSARSLVINKQFQLTQKFGLETKEMADLVLTRYAQQLYINHSLLQKFQQSELQLMQKTALLRQIQDSIRQEYLGSLQHQTLQSIDNVSRPQEVRHKLLAHNNNFLFNFSFSLQGLLRKSINVLSILSSSSFSVQSYLQSMVQMADRFQLGVFKNNIRSSSVLMRKQVYRTPLTRSSLVQILRERLNQKQTQQVVASIISDPNVHFILNKELLDQQLSITKDNQPKLKSIMISIKKKSCENLIKLCSQTLNIFRQFYEEFIQFSFQPEIDKLSFTRGGRQVIRRRQQQQICYDPYKQFQKKQQSVKKRSFIRQNLKNISKRVQELRKSDIRLSTFNLDLKFTPKQMSEIKGKSLKKKRIQGVSLASSFDFKKF